MIVYTGYSVNCLPINNSTEYYILLSRFNPSTLSFTNLSPSINVDDADNTADDSDDGGDDNDDDDDNGNQCEGRTRITLVLHTMPER